MENFFPWYKIEECFICQGKGLLEILDESFSEYGERKTKTVQCPQCLGDGELRIRKGKDE